jgi:hypothetical protein
LGNETADYYRFVDATPFAEFLYRCAEETIGQDLPQEARFLMNYDQFRTTVQNTVEMPDRMVFLLHRFLSQHGGTLSRRAKEQEFAALSEEEVTRFEQLYDQLFAQDKDTGSTSSGGDREF